MKKSISTLLFTLLITSICNAQYDRYKYNSDAISEFYGYSAVTLTSFSGSVDRSNIFQACVAFLTQTYYHDGSGTIPVAGDVVYTNSGGTSPLGSGIYRSWNGGYMVLTFSTGLVSSTGNCGAYDGYKYNSDGSYSVGRAYDGYKMNPDGNYSVGWEKCRK